MDFLFLPVNHQLNNNPLFTHVTLRSAKPSLGSKYFFGFPFYYIQGKIIRVILCASPSHFYPEIKITLKYPFPIDVSRLAVPW